jgi:O-antigen/teichoic acid export membrane protein
MSSRTETSAFSGIWGQLLRYLPGQVLPPIVVVLTLPFLTRHLSEVEYGRYILVLTTVTVLNQFALAWIPNCALRFYHPMRNEQSSYVSQLFVSWFFAGCVLLLFALASWRFIPEKYAQILYISLPIGLLSSGNSIVNAYFRAREQSINYSIMLGLGTFMRLIPGLILLLFFDGTLNDFLLAWLVSFVVLFLFQVRYSGMGKFFSLRKIKGSLLMEFVKYGFPLVAAGLFNTAMNSSDRYMLSGFRSDVEVALYGVCFQLGMVPIQFVSRAITLVLLPRSIQLFHDNPQQVAQLLQQGLRFTIILVLPVIAVGIGASEWLLEHMAKPTYARAAPALTPILIGAFLLGLTHMYRMVFMVHQQTPVIARIAVYGAVLSVGLNLALIPAFGYMGSAWTYFGTQLLLLLMTVRTATSREPIAFPWRIFTLTLIAGLLLFGLTRWVVCLL